MEVILKASIELSVPFGTPETSLLADGQALGASLLPCVEDRTQASCNACGGFLGDGILAGLSHTFQTAEHPFPSGHPLFSLLLPSK